MAIHLILLAPRLRQVLIEYPKKRGGATMQEIVGDRSGPFQRLAKSMDTIGWRRFMEGMISSEVLEIQRNSNGLGQRRISVEKWGAGLVTRLLEVTHRQWLYRNVHVHDALTGDIASRRKEDLRKELEDQMEIGGAGLAEEDMFLLEINLNDLDTTSGEEQIYWLLALRAARIAFQLMRDNDSNRNSTGTNQS